MASAPPVDVVEEERAETGDVSDAMEGVIPGVNVSANMTPAEIRNYLSGLPVEQRMPRARELYERGSEYVEGIEDRMVTMLQYIYNDAAIRGEMSDQEWAAYLDNNFMDHRALITRVEATRNRKSEAVRSIIAAWPEAATVPYIVDNPTKNRLDQIRRMIIIRVEGRPLAWHQVLRSANRQLLARFMRPPERNKSELFPSIGDWTAARTSPSFGPYTAEELGNFERQGLGVLASGLLVELGVARSQGLVTLTEETMAQREHQDDAGSLTTVLGAPRTTNTANTANTAVAAAPGLLSHPGVQQLVRTRGQARALLDLERANARVTGAIDDINAPLDLAPGEAEASSNMQIVDPDTNETRTLTVGEATNATKCYCDAKIKAMVESRLSVTNSNDDSEVLVLVDYILNTVVGADLNCCIKHLRLVAGKCGFYNRKLNTTRAHELFRMFLDNSHRLFQLRNMAPTASLFKQGSRLDRESDYRDVYKYAHVEPTPAPAFDHEAKLEQLFPGAFAKWEDDGTVNVPCFRWWDETGLLDVFMEEVQMYHYHFRLRPNTSDLGWLRNMYHSVTQQAMRMDPIYWLLYVCLRPDHGHRLISYPYYAKYALPGAASFFLHMDINPVRASDDDYGINMIQGSLSLTDESEDDCTVVVKGMHKFLGSWLDKARARGDDPLNGSVVAFGPDVYTKEDQEAFAQWTKVPCKKGDVRITLPTIAHGSTGPTVNTRITLLPWFELINEDHATLELPEGGTYEDLARAHRDLLPGPKTPSGRPVVYGTAKYAFPATVHLESPTAIGNAILGRKRWDNVEVQAEVKLLMQGTQEELHAYTAKYRTEMARNVRSAMAKVHQFEREAFQHKSYFYVTENGLPIPPTDDPDPVDAQADNDEDSENGQPTDEDAALLEGLEVDTSELEDPLPRDNRRNRSEGSASTLDSQEEYPESEGMGD